MERQKHRKHLLRQNLRATTHEVNKGIRWQKRQALPGIPKPRPEDSQIRHECDKEINS